ncbi:MAG: hypothetical protein WD176_00370, partial [Pirellulales bacterium]
SVSQTFTPLHMLRARPTITNSTIVGSSGAAIGADPNSFEESKFRNNDPGTAFTSDYDRVGPEIHGNRLSTLLIGNTLQISSVSSGSIPISVTTQVAHGFQTGDRVRISGVLGNTAANGDFTVTVTSGTTFSLNGAIGNGTFIASGADVVNRLVTLDNSVNGLFVRIRIQAGSPIDKLDVSARFDDTDIVHVFSQALVLSGTPGGPRQQTVAGVGVVNAARQDARLAIDPGTIVKFDGARIETQIGTQLIAEGTVENLVVFTSIQDDRYGRSGTFDTNTDLGATVGGPGNWGGLFFDRLSTGSLDHTLLTFGGGSSTIEGSTDDFNIVEIHQADVRLANSMIRDNADGQAAGGRNNRGTNADTTIFIRGAQPIIVNNIIRDNAGSTLNVNVNSLNTLVQSDTGRSVGAAEASVPEFANLGPLIRNNRLQNNGLNGMVVRGGVLTTASVWDDTDIAHVVFDEVEVANHHTSGGLRLQSNATESLVVKLDGTTAGFTANGRL